MKSLGARLDREEKTIRAMTAIHCRAHHDRQFGVPCPQCTLFLAYAVARVEYCTFGEDKPACSQCPIHCYKPAQRETARQIMRYAGPRMLFLHPWLSLMHFWDKFRSQYRISRKRRLGTTQNR